MMKYVVPLPNVCGEHYSKHVYMNIPKDNYDERFTHIDATPEAIKTPHLLRDPSIHKNHSTLQELYPSRRNSSEELLSTGQRTLIVYPTVTIANHKYCCQFDGN